MISSQSSTSRPLVDDVLDILSSQHDSDLAEIVELAASICGAEAAGITIRRGGRYHVMITHGIAPFVCPAEETFCQETMEVQGLFAVRDAKADPRFADIGFVNGQLARARFYASAPIHDPLGSMVGRLCVIADQPKDMSEVQVRALETLGLSVSKIIELRLLRAAGPPPAAEPVEHDVTTLLTQLSAELSHDLRVPLTTLMASVEMAKEELGDQGGSVLSILLDRSAAAADRMHRMLDQHMNAASAAYDGAAPVVTDLAAVAGRVVDECASLVETMGAAIEVDDLPVVRADPDEMYSVFQNLVTNSLKFGRPRVPVRIRITARPDGGWWRVAALDNGVGIPLERRADVFSLFSRAHADVDGHGIGLATVARIISAHGGRVGADEAPGGGTEIWFTLPAA